MKKKARAPETGTPVLVRLQEEQIKAIDAWRRSQHDLPSRPEAMRRLVEKALGENSKRR